MKHFERKKIIKTWNKKNSLYALIYICTIFYYKQLHTYIQQSYIFTLYYIIIKKNSKMEKSKQKIMD